MHQKCCSKFASLCRFILFCLLVESGCCLPPPYKLVSGNKLSVKVSYTESPANFYVQIIDHKEEMYEMQEKLQIFYNELESEELPDPIEKGVVCAARYDIYMQ